MKADFEFTIARCKSDSKPLTYLETGGTNNFGKVFLHTKISFARWTKSYTSQCVKSSLSKWEMESSPKWRKCWETGICWGIAENRNNNKTVMEFAFFKKCHGVCLHPHPWRLYLRTLLLKWPPGFHQFIASYKHHIDFAVIRSSTNISEPFCCSQTDLQDTPGFLVPPSPGDPARTSAEPICCTQMGLLAKGTTAVGGRREGAATRPGCALGCPRQTVTRAPTSSQVADAFPGPAL